MDDDYGIQIMWSGQGVSRGHPKMGDFHQAVTATTFWDVHDALWEPHDPLWGADSDWDDTRNALAQLGVTL